MNVRLTQLDGKLPNLALMRLAAWHRSRGDKLYFETSPTRGIFEPEYGAVYGSAIFTATMPDVNQFRLQFPGAFVGGTGSGENTTLEETIPDVGNEMDYSIYPEYRHSIGFLTRGCRLKCKFCVVPTKEGKPFAQSMVHEVWRGKPHPRTLMLLDNDFFALPAWREHVDAIVAGKFRVCLSQGINVRLVDDEQAEALASMEYRDGEFRRRRLYTAWDSVGQERIFFRGIDRLEAAGIPPKHIMAYMLIGWAKGETMNLIQYRFDRMVAMGILPYPMVYGDRPDLKRFQRWAVTGLYRALPFSEYRG